MRYLALVMLALILGFGCGRAVAEETPPGPSPTATTEAEAELGAKTAAQIEKEYKLVDDQAALKRLHEIANSIAPHTQRPDVTYTCKILDTGALNAMALPGGIIYVTKGLLEAVESDDELAGVIAHEIAHNSLYHSKRMMEREAKYSIAQILVAIGAVYSSDRDSNVDSMQLLMMSELFKQGLLNGYSQELEIEADANAVDYLDKLGKYSSVGLYSVILGFHQIESRRPFRDFGYMKTHPYSDERKVLLEKALKEKKVKINIWQVVNFRADVLPPVEGETGYGVRMGTVPIITFTAPDGGLDPKARAQAASEMINRRLQRDYLQVFDVDVDRQQDRAAVRLRAIPVFTLTAADAEAAGMTLDALATMVQMKMQSAIRHELIKRS